MRFNQVLLQKTKTRVPLFKVLRQGIILLVEQSLDGVHEQQDPPWTQDASNFIEELVVVGNVEIDGSTVDDVEALGVVSNREVNVVHLESDGGGGGP